MGGPPWTLEEEKYFWRIAVRQSLQRAPVDFEKPEKTWAELGREMQEEMGGLAAPRKYTSSVMASHYSINMYPKGQLRPSDCAEPYVKEHKDRLNGIVKPPYNGNTNPPNGNTNPPNGSS